MYELISIVACPAAELQLELANEYSQSFTVPGEGLITICEIGTLVHKDHK